MQHTFKPFHICITKKFRQHIKIAIITASHGFIQISVNVANQVSNQKSKVVFIISLFRGLHVTTTYSLSHICLYLTFTLHLVHCATQYCCFTLNTTFTVYTGDTNFFFRPPALDLLTFSSMFLVYFHLSRVKLSS